MQQTLVSYGMPLQLAQRSSEKFSGCLANVLRKKSMCFLHIRCGNMDGVRGRTLEKVCPSPCLSLEMHVAKMCPAWELLAWVKMKRELIGSQVHYFPNHAKDHIDWHKIGVF